MNKGGMRGIIVKNISNYYLVKCEDGNRYECRPLGKLRYQKKIPLVGDYVWIDDNYCIIKIEERKNSLVRPSVANVDQAILVTSVKGPDLDLNLLDKLLTIISYYSIRPIICFTKLDKLSDSEFVSIKKYMDYYERYGYLVITNFDSSGYEDIFRDKVSVLVGQSGAGKSSFLNRLDSRLNLKTNEISKALNRGKHTTRHTELYEVMGGYIVDTPGFSSVDFRNLSKEAIRDNMNEMFVFLHECKYRDCMHLDEDGCALKRKVLQGEVLESRYLNYKRFLKSKD